MNQRSAVSKSKSAVLPPPGSHVAWTARRDVQEGKYYCLPNVVIVYHESNSGRTRIEMVVLIVAPLTSYF